MCHETNVVEDEGRNQLFVDRHGRDVCCCSCYRLPHWMPARIGKEPGYWSSCFLAMFPLSWNISSAMPNYFFSVHNRVSGENSKLAADTLLYIGSWLQNIFFSYIHYYHPFTIGGSEKHGAEWNCKWQNFRPFARNSTPSVALHGIEVKPGGSYQSSHVHFFVLIYYICVANDK